MWISKAMLSMGHTESCTDLQWSTGNLWVTWSCLRAPHVTHSALAKAKNTLRFLPLVQKGQDIM